MRRASPIMQRSDTASAPAQQPTVGPQSARGVALLGACAALAIYVMAVVIDSDPRK